MWSWCSKWQSNEIWLCLWLFYFRWLQLTVVLKTLIQKPKHIKITVLNLCAKWWINEQWILHHPSLTYLLCKMHKKRINLKSPPPSQKKNNFLYQNHWSHYRYILRSNINKLKTMKKIDMNELLANIPRFCN